MNMNPTDRPDDTGTDEDSGADENGRGTGEGEGGDERGEGGTGEDERGEGGPGEGDGDPGDEVSEDAMTRGAGAAGGAGGADRTRRGRPTAALTEAARRIPSPPPRRTGVFVDPTDLREHVGALLRSILGGYEVDAFGNYTFVHEGARIFVTVGVSPFGPHVGVVSVTNVDVALTAELGAFLLTTNHRLGYGAFSYDPPNQAVWLRHTLLGTALDVPELQAALAAVSTTAAELDDTIHERFGGRRFQDAPSEMQQRMEPPQPGEGPPPNASGYL